MKINIGIADDHQLFVKSLCILVGSFTQFNVLLDADEVKKMKAALNAL